MYESEIGLDEGPQYERKCLTGKPRILCGELHMVFSHDFIRIIPEEYKVSLLAKRGGRTKSREGDIG